MDLKKLPTQCIGPLNKDVSRVLVRKGGTFYSGGGGGIKKNQNVFLCSFVTFLQVGHNFWGRGVPAWQPASAEYRLVPEQIIVTCLTPVYKERMVSCVPSDYATGKGAKV